MKSKTLIASFVAGFLVSIAMADEMTINGTSKETFAASAAAMAESLKPDEKAIYRDGLLNLILTRYPPADGAQGLSLLAMMPQAMEVAHTTMNGVTKTEILERGRELAKKSGKGLANATSTHTSEYSNIRSCLQSKVIVANAKIEETDFGRNIKLDVTNNLSWPISFVHIGYKVTTPGRSVPWSDKNFGISVSGGIEPGETRSIATNAFGIAKLANDMQTEAQILDVADAEKRHLVGEVYFMDHSKEPTPNGCN